MPPRRTGKHAPCRYSSYLQTHDTLLTQVVSDGFAGDLDYSVKPFPDCAKLAGFICCRGRLLVTYEKLMYVMGQVEGEDAWQTEMYSYNVSLQGSWNLFRYDNQHPDSLHHGHKDAHHKHEYDPHTGKELPHSPVWIGEESWPTLREVIEEARNWHAMHYHDLPHPEEFAALPEWKL